MYLTANSRQAALKSYFTRMVQVAIIFVCLGLSHTTFALRAPINESPIIPPISPPTSKCPPNSKCISGQPPLPTAGDAYDAFQRVMTVSPVSIIVPTVVEVPVSFDEGERGNVAVYEVQSGENVPYFMHETYAKDPTIVRAYSGSGNDYALTDENEETGVDYFLDEARVNTITITLTAEKPVTASSLILDLDQYVALPTQVALTAYVDESIERTIIASTRIYSPVITFPQTVATRFTLILTYAQPLRINEIRLIQDDMKNTVSRGIRFLAQPGSAYMIYHDPDRAVSIPTLEQGDLRSDSGVRKLAPVRSDSNPSYRQADIDGDGIVDRNDNCVRTVNSDQLDIDRNGRGDACDDFDRDGITQTIDNCPNQTNARQSDEDGDGIGDACDTEESRFTEKYPWVPWVGMGIAILVLIVLFALVAMTPKKLEDGTVV